MTDLADKVVAAAASAAPRSVSGRSIDRDLPLEAKITADRDEGLRRGPRVVQAGGSARGCSSSPRSATATLPVCIAKTQYSFTDDPKVMGAPTGWTLNITDATLSAGAGFVVAIAGSMMLMPGLGKTPQAHKLDVDDGRQRRGDGVLKAPSISGVDSCVRSIVKTSRTRMMAATAGSLMTRS